MFGRSLATNLATHSQCCKSVQCRGTDQREYLCRRYSSTSIEAKVVVSNNVVGAVCRVYYGRSTIPTLQGVEHGTFYSTAV